VCDAIASFWIGISRRVCFTGNSGDESEEEESDGSIHDVTGDEGEDKGDGPGSVGGRGVWMGACETGDKTGACVTRDRTGVCGTGDRTGACRTLVHIVV